MFNPMTLIDTIVGILAIPVLVAVNLVSFIKDVLTGAPTL